MGDDGEPSVGFRYGGRPRRAPRGRSLAAALTEDGPPILQRSVRYHRPRAPFCGIGACTQCLVRVNGVPNVRACRYEPSEGDRVESENAWPSPRLDLLGVLDRIFPHGIDSVRGFRRPAVARPIYQRVVRRMAAFGRLPDPEATAALPPSRRLVTPCLIVGAGTAGRAVAEGLVRSGIRPMLLDRDAIPDPPDGVDLVPRTTASFLPAPRADRPEPFELLAAADDGTALRIAARRVVVATGAYDAALWLADGDRPGVLTADGAIALTSTPRGPPFRKAVLFGGGDRAGELLGRWGDRFTAVVAPGPIEPGVVRLAAERGIPLYPRSLLLGITGRRGVRAVTMRARGHGPRAILPADALVLAHRRLPHAQLLFQAGATMYWSSRTGAYRPELRDGATTVPGLLAAGAAFGAPDTTVVVDRARSEVGWPTERPAPPAEGPGEMEGYYRELLSEGLTGGRWTACPCEDVGVAEILDAGRRGYRGLEVIKRYTGVGTGLCQGRYCLPETVLLLAQAESRPPPEVGYITQRPPVFPARLDTLASLPPEE